MLNSIPKPILVAAVLILGVIGIFIYQPPHRQCESQIDVLRNQQKGKIFQGSVKGKSRQAKIFRQIDTCKLGNSPGACYEMFSTLRGLIDDLNVLPLDCSADLAEVAEVKGSLQEGITLLVQIAWGEFPPEKNGLNINRSWLELSDLALFCSLRDIYTRIYGVELSEELKQKILNKLPGEAPLIQEGKCENCESRKTAQEVLDPEDLIQRSLFGVRCDLYR